MYIFFRERLPTLGNNGKWRRIEEGLFWGRNVQQVLYGWRSCAIKSRGPCVNQMYIRFSQVDTRWRQMEHVYRCFVKLMIVFVLYMLEVKRNIFKIIVIVVYFRRNAFNLKKKISNDQVQKIYLFYDYWNVCVYFDLFILATSCLFPL